MSRFSRPKALGLAGALGVLAVAAFLVLGADGSSEAPLRIEVFAKQYSWSFGYPEEGYAFSKGEFHVPVGRPIEFEMHSEDVLHAFWMPEWKVKVDTPPAQVETVEVTPEKVGAFQLICAQFCGLLHSDMRAKIVVESQAQYRRWVNGLPGTPAHLRELARLDRELESIHESSASQASP
jgi:cytochrome c oxidase subunit 2